MSPELIFFDIKMPEIRKHYDSRYVLIMDDYTQSKITSGRSYFQGIKSLLEY